MSVSIRPPLLTSTSDLDEPEPWVMTAVPGAVLVAPIRLLTARQRLATSPEDLVLGLTDLGYLGSPGAPAAAAGIQVVPAPSELVLVLPAELLDHVARVRLRALRFGVQVATSAQSFDPDAWLTTWHHFVDSTQGLAMTLLDQSREANGELRLLPSDAGRRYVFATPHDTEPALLLDRFGGLRSFANAEQLDHRHPSFAADPELPGVTAAGPPLAMQPDAPLHLLEGSAPIR